MAFNVTPQQPESDGVDKADQASVAQRQPSSPPSLLPQSIRIIGVLWWLGLVSVAVYSHYRVVTLLISSEHGVQVPTALVLSGLSISIISLLIYTGQKVFLE